MKLQYISIATHSLKESIDFYMLWFTVTKYVIVYWLALSLCIIYNFNIAALGYFLGVIKTASLSLTFILILS
jgi:hypothetical protein